MGEAAEHIHALVVEGFGLPAVREEREGCSARRIRPAIGGADAAMTEGARMGDRGPNFSARLRGETGRSSKVNDLSCAGW